METVETMPALGTVGTADTARLRPVDPAAPVHGRRAGVCHSPLRYPGGKRRLAPFVADLLRAGDGPVDTFVEPFAGGASVGLHVLSQGLGRRLVLGDRDPLVAAFWRVATRDADWLVDRVARTTPSLDTWNRLRASAPRSDRERAWKALYLNRTSFSGILSRTAGPIGGQAQTSDYGIGCRFPTATLVRRIRQVAALGTRIDVVEGDWQATVAQETTGRATGASAFVYLDPPFYRKADRLYRYCFADADHRALRDAVARLDVPFLLSYDAAPEIEALYRGAAHVHRVELLYAATERARLVPARELLITNVDAVPASTRLWRSDGE